MPEGAFCVVGANAAVNVHNTHTGQELPLDSSNCADRNEPAMYFDTSATDGEIYQISYDVCEDYFIRSESTRVDDLARQANLIAARAAARAGKTCSIVDNCKDGSVNGNDVCIEASYIWGSCGHPDGVGNGGAYSAKSVCENHGTDCGPNEDLQCIWTPAWEGLACELLPGLNAFNVTTTDGSQTSCLPSDMGQINDGTHYSRGPCLMYEAAKIAKEDSDAAKKEAMKTCDVVNNCETPAGLNHPCEKRAIDATGKNEFEAGVGDFVDIEFACTIKTFTSGVFDGDSAYDNNNCPNDWLQDGHVQGTVESVHICDSYAALARAGFTCTVHENCDNTGCILDPDAPAGELIHHCQLKTDVTSACTDVDSNGFSQEACVSKTAEARFEKSQEDAKKTCQPDRNCRKSTAASIIEYNGCRPNLGDSIVPEADVEDAGRFWCLIGSEHLDSASGHWLW